jgi:hypothetical protein
MTFAKARIAKFIKTRAGTSPRVAPLLEPESRSDKKRQPTARKPPESQAPNKNSRGFACGAGPAWKGSGATSIPYSAAKTPSTFSFRTVSRDARTLIAICAILAMSQN